MQGALLWGVTTELDMVRSHPYAAQQSTYGEDTELFPRGDGPAARSGS